MNNKFVRFLLVLAIVGLFGSISPGAAAPNATWYVSPTGNNANTCNSPAQACASIQYVIDNKAAGGDTIFVSGGTYTGGVNEVVTINKSIALLSGGWNTAFTLQSEITILDGQDARRSIYVGQGITTTIEKLSLTNGSASDGGAILNVGNLTLIDCLISDNVAGQKGGGISSESGTSLHLLRSQVVGNTANVFSGGGIYTKGTTRLDDSAIVDNQAASDGGGIYAESTLYVVNSTITGNQAAVYGGGINYSGSGGLKIHSSTIARNQASEGGGLFTAGLTAYLLNTILASNSASVNRPDCAGNVVASYSIIQNMTCSLVGGSGFLGVDPLLLPPEGTPTYLPTQPGAPPVNAGNPGGCLDPDGVLLTHDQRGKPRYGICDMGAYELQPLGFSHKVADPEILLPGDTTTFSIWLTDGQNNNPIPGVTVSDPLPAGLSYVNGTLSASHGTPSYSSGVISWNGDVPANTIVQISFDAMLDAGAPLGQPIWNEATISGAGETFVRKASVSSGAFQFMGKVNQGCEPLYADDFSDPNSGWPEEYSSDTSYGYQGGWYHIEEYQSWWNVWVTPSVAAAPIFDGYTYAADAWWDSGSAGSFGLLFGLDYSGVPFFTFEIDPSGYFSIWEFSNDEWTLLADGSSSAIKPTQRNRLIIDVDFPYVDFYINNAYLGWLDIPSMPPNPWFGLTLSTYASGFFSANYDNAAVYPLVCGSDFTETGGITSNLNGENMLQAGKGQEVRKSLNR